MLGEWVDRLERLLAARSLPVSEQLVFVQRCPLGDERERASRERAGDQLAGELRRPRLRSQHVSVAARARAPSLVAKGASQQLDLVAMSAAAAQAEPRERPYRGS